MSNAAEKPNGFLAPHPLVAEPAEAAERGDGDRDAVPREGPPPSNRVLMPRHNALVTPPPAPGMSPAEGGAPAALVTAKVKLRLRQRITISTLLTMITLSSVIGLSAVVGYFALSTVYDNKVKDTWAIQFLDLEEKAHGVGQVLQARRDAALRGEAPAALFKRSGTALAPLSGPFKDRLKLVDLGIDAPTFGTGVTVAARDGRTYLAAPLTAEQARPWTTLAGGSDGLVGLWPLDLARTIGVRGGGDKALLYALTTVGLAVYSNDSRFQSGRAQERQLVQAFIRSPLTQGQITFKDPKNGPSFGFFHHVTGSNLVFFSETSKAFALRDVYDILARFAMIVAFSILAAFLASQVPLQLVSRQIRELVGLATEIGRGNFQVTPKHEGFGELWFLHKAFGSMGASLAARDQKIVTLQVQEREKNRLESELAIARRIQDNLLPREMLPPSAPFDLASTYQPATEVAGDWYGIAYDEERREVVVAVADVTGHGAGAAMFTTVIAAAFEDAKHLRVRGGAAFDMQEFVSKANRLLYNLGRGEWYASLVVARAREGSGKLELVSAGHCPGLLVGAGKLRAMLAPGGLLGCSPELALATREFPFARGDFTVFFTDGITEAKGPDDTQYGKRRLREASRMVAGQSAAMIQQRVLVSWRAHCGAVPPNDDACLLVLKAR